MHPIKDLERQLERLYNRFPHLPESWVSFAGRNLWWLLLIYIICFAIGIAGLVMGTYFRDTLAKLAQQSQADIPALLPPDASEVNYIAAGVVISLYIVTAILLSLAVVPLKKNKKIGWTLVFSVAVLVFIVGLGSSLAILSVVDILSNIAVSLLWGYILFEIRPAFTQTKNKDKK